MGGEPPCVKPLHGGEEFTAGDVVATIEQTLDKSTAGVSYNVFGPVGGLDAVKEKPNGTGPFIFKDFQPGSSITVEHNPEYWDRDNIRLDGVRMVFIRESVAMQAALRGGQVDLITRLPVETYLALKSASGLRAYSAVTGLTINVRDIPYTEYAANVARKKPMYNYHFSGSATLYDGVYRVYHSKGSYNYSGIEAGTDAVLDSMLAEVDTAKRREIAFGAMRRIHENSDRVIPYFRNYIGVTSDKVQGFTPPRFGTIETRTIWLSA